MHKREDLKSELSNGLSFASSMSAVSLFFTGIIVAQYDSFDDSIRIPIIFLVISTFSFIFAAAIYSNAGTEITAGKITSAEKYLIYAKNLVELMGLYLFVLATPLVLGAVTQDTFLKVATVIIAITGLVLFSQSKFSILHKELRKNTRRFGGAGITALALLLYIAQENAGMDDGLFLYSAIAVEIILILVATTLRFSTNTKRYKPLKIRDFRNSDADRLSMIVTTILDKASSKEISDKDRKKLKRQASPLNIKKLSKKATIKVATFDGQISGMAAIEKGSISNVYVDPKQQDKGIGRLLLERIEDCAENEGTETCKVTASKSTLNFYSKLGYKPTSDKDEDSMSLEKSL